MTRRAKLSSWLMLVAAVVAAAVLVKCTAFPGREFDAAVWRDPGRLESGVRLGMADRLVAQRSLLGRTRAEVVTMLGEPPPTEYFREWDLVYWLGPERSWFSIDSEWLVVRLGPDGRVAEARIIRD